MDDVPPSYESAIQRDYWSIIAKYVHSSADLCAASRVCRRWHQIYTPLLWGNPASHFGTENDRVYVALTRFKRSLKRVRLAVRSLTHTLHLPPAQAEIYDGPHPEWLRDVLLKLPNLQSLVVSQLPFFDHPSLVALQANGGHTLEDRETQPTFALRLLIANQCTNTTQRSLSHALTAFPHLIFLDLSRTLGVRDVSVLSKLRHMDSLQILKLCGIQLRDDDMGVLAKSIGIRLRSLDVRDNLLTDQSVRILLYSCFQTTNDESSFGSTRPRGLSGAAEEDWPSGILKPDPAVLDEFRDESFDERYLRRLTQGLVSRMPSEDQADTGITHLHIANNRLTVEGVSSLLQSTRLHVLDAGVLDTARHVHRSSSTISPSSPYFRDRTIDIPGAEKLTPVLARYASKRLTSLRVNHSIITKSALPDEAESSPELYEMPSVSRRHELDATVPAYELHSDREERFELPGDSMHLVLTPAMGAKPEVLEPLAPPLPKRGSIYAPEVVTNNSNAITDTEDDVPVLTATGLEHVLPAINHIESPWSNNLSTVVKVDAEHSPTIPHLSHSTIEKQRQNMHLVQCSEPHGLLPSMLPQLRSLTLTDVPCYDESGQVVSALIKFIQYCASEFELAKLQADLESKISRNSPYGRARPRRQATINCFALRKLTLEMSSPETSAPGSLQPGSSQTSQAALSTFRSRSSTEDADSEAFWAAQEKDFSFFDDDAECGLPSVEPGSHFPMSTLSEKMILPTDSQASPAVQRNSKADLGLDVVQELIRFRKDRKAAYESALKQGRTTAEGYWPGEVKVVRRQGGKSATVDYYGNYFEKGYIYR